MTGDIELRVRGTVLGVIVGGTALLVKKGCRMYAVDWFGSVQQGAAVIFERVLHPEGEADEEVWQDANPSILE